MFVGNQYETRIEFRLAAVQQLQGLASNRMAHDDVALQRVVVERVQWLAKFQHHVVGDVDHGADRAQTRAAQALGQPPRGVRGWIDAFDDAAQITRRVLAGFESDAAACIAGYGCCDLCRYFHRTAEQRRDIMRETDQTQAIGTVRRELQLDAGIGKAQIIGQRLAHRRIQRQLKQAGGIGIDAQLLGRTEHAERLHATQLGGLDRHATRQAGAHHGQRHLDADARIRRATDDLQQLALPRVHLAHLQTIGFGMLFGGDDLGHHHTSQAFAQHGQFFHFQPGHGQCVSQCGAVGLDLDQLAQPVLGEFHRVVS